MQHTHLDFETRSELSVKDVGAHVYANHPSTQIMCLAFAVDDAPVVLVTEEGLDEYDVGSSQLFELAEDPNVVFMAHNRFFEACVWEAIMVEQLGFPKIPLERWRCTAAKGAQRSLPRKLDLLGKALELPVQKDMAGNSTMLQLSRTRRPSASNPDKFWRPDTAPQKFQKLYEYNMDDVRCERYVDQWLPDMPKSELAIWFMDQRMNERGLKLDLEAVRCAVALLKEAHEIALTRFRKATGNALNSPLQRDKFKAWLSERGLNLPNLQGATLDEHIQLAEEVPYLPDDVLTALKMAKLLGRSSTKKYQAMLDRVSTDGRLRDYLMYHGADRTGRWSGQGVQPQNLLRVPKGFNIEIGVADIKRYDYEMMELIYGDVISAIAYCVRGMIISSDDHELFVSDFKGIESRVLAWLAGQDDLLEFFRRFDAGLEANDNYCLLASSITGREITVKDDDERQMGKVGELALGFNGGINAFVTMAGAYRLNLETLFPLVWPTATADEKENAKINYKAYRRKNTEPISPQAGCAVDVIKQRYRKSRPAIKKFWSNLEKAAVRCVEDEGPQTVGYLRFEMEGEGSTQFLRLHLPSGRALSYHLPKIKHQETTWNKKKSIKKVLTYVEIDAQTKRPVREATYGGKLAENATQAVARDLMAHAFLRIEKASYLPLLSVHDEAISERKIGEGGIDEYNAIMRKTPGWAKDLPIDVSGWTGKRYKKG